MDSPTLLCIDLPQILELRKKTLESHGHSVKLASSRHTAMNVGGIAGRCGSIGVQTRGLGSNSLPHQATVSQCAHHLAFSVFRHAGVSPVAIR